MITLSLYLMQGVQYLVISFIITCAICIIIDLLQKIYRFIYKNNMFHRINIKLFVQIWYVLFVLFVVFADRVNTLERLLNLSLFISYKEAFLDFSTEILLNIFFNIILFIPFGLLFSSSYNNKKQHWLVFIIGLISIVCIEGIQYYFSLGIADVDDVINNFLGIIIGYCLYQLVHIFTHPREANAKKMTLIYIFSLYLS